MKNLIIFASGLAIGLFISKSFEFGKTKSTIGQLSPQGDAINGTKTTK